MGKRRLVIAIILGGVILLGLWNCSTPAGRSAGQVIDDATITTAVKTKIFADSILKGFAISVETFQGEVTLTGAVKTSQERNHAGFLARNTNGVRKVHNLIKIK